MPRVWISYDYGGFRVSETEVPYGTSVEMNASLYRQVIAADKKFRKFQDLLSKWYIEKPGRIS